MFTFLSVELLNWDLWDHVRVPMDGQVVLLTGPNGSGKTTFLDALRVLLNARRLSTSRRIESYLRGDVKVAVVKAAVSNELRRGTGARPFTRRGLFDDRVTLACAITRGPRGLERRYQILGGDVPVAELREAQGWMGPEAYSAALEEAGVPRTMLKVLALEQGETHRLSRRTPEQLLAYVLEMQGDSEVLDRYARAVDHYRGARRELEELERSLGEHERHVAGLAEQARQVTRLQEIEARVQGIRARRLPAARLKAVRLRLAEAESELRRRRDALVGLQSHAQETSTATERHRGEAERLDARRKELAEAQRRLLGEKDRADRRARDLRGKLSRLEQLRADAEQAGAAELPEKPEGVLEALREEEARSLVAMRALEEELEAADAVAGRGEVLPPLPAYVHRTVEAMVEAGIPAIPVAHMIRIVRARWRLAVESVLGRDRFTLVVPAARALEARRVARERRYGCYVTERGGGGGDLPPPPPGTALSAVHPEDPDLPRWIADRLASVRLVDDLEEGLRLSREGVTITEDGYRQDRRGGIHVAVDRLHCLHGPAGGAAGDASARERIEDLRAQVRRAEKRLLDAARRRDRLEAALRARDLVARAECAETDLDGLRAEAETQDRRRRELSQEIFAVLKELEEVHEARVAGERHRTRHEAAVAGVRARQESLRAGVLEAQAVAERLRGEAASLEELLPPELRTEAILELEGSPEALKERLRILEEQLEGWTGPRDRRILEIHRKAVAEMEARRAHLLGRREEQGAGEAELERARRAYLRVLAETVGRYRANIVTLAERARIEAVVRAPRPTLGPDGAAFAGGLEVRLGFDGKSPVPIGHPKLSGGQNVIASLILLMALTMQERKGLSGFFILDEPFAHLSAERVDEVARFLRMTRSQFILTSPTTHNLMTYQPADLVVTLRKKGRDDPAAPPPIFIRAA